MRPTFVVATLLLAMILAGCASGPTEIRPESTDTHRFASPATFTDTTGAVAGMVTDDQLLPIEGALVALNSMGVITTTDPEGRFSLSELTPGDFTIIASREGYESDVQELSVLAGQATSIQLVIHAVAAPVARYVTLQADGFWSCWVPFVINPVCDGVELINDDFGGDFPVEANFSALALEVAWVRNSGITSASDAQVHLRTNATSFKGEGPSPVRVVAEAGKADAGGKTPQTNVTQVSWQAFPGRGADAIMQGNVLTYQQRFKVYLSVFHHMELPTDFTAIPDG